MYAIELRANVRDGRIEIPAEYRGRFHGQVRIILLAPEPAETQAADDVISELMRSPLQVDDPTPLSREAIYAGRG